MQGSPKTTTHSASEAGGAASSFGSTPSSRPGLPAPIPVRQPSAQGVYGYNIQTGETIPARASADAPRSRGWAWDGAQIHPIQNVRAFHSAPQETTTRGPNTAPSTTTRFHAEPTRPPPAQDAGRYLDSPYYPQPSSHVSAVELLSDQVASLEDRLSKVLDILNRERIDNVRDRLDFTSYLLQLTDWIGAGRSKCHPLDPTDPPRPPASRAAGVARYPEQIKPRLSSSIRNPHSV